MMLGHPFGTASDELGRLIDFSPFVIKPLVALTATALVLALGNGLVVLTRRINKPSDTRKGETLTLVVLSATGAALLVALVALGWPARDLGLAMPELRGLGWPATALVWAAGLVVVVFGVIAVKKSSSPHDAAAPRLKLARLLLGTAFGEEALHRGFLLAIWCGTDTNSGRIVAVNAVGFGLWHVAGAIKGKRFRCCDVAVPALGALLFLWGRLATGSLLTPILLHAAINVSGIARDRKPSVG